MSESNYKVLSTTKERVKSFVVNSDLNRWKRENPPFLARLFKNHRDYYFMKINGLVFKLIVKLIEKDTYNEYIYLVCKYYQIEVWEEGNDTLKLSFDYQGDSSLIVFESQLKNTNKYAFEWDKRKLAERVLERIKS